MSRTVTVRPDEDLDRKIARWDSAMRKKLQPGQRLTTSDVVRAMLNAAPEKPAEPKRT